MDARYEFFSKLDGRESNNRNHLRYDIAYSSTAIERRAHLVCENLSGREDCDYHCENACISFDATCVGRVSPNRAVNPTTGLVSRIGEGSVGFETSVEGSRSRKGKRVRDANLLRHVLRSSHLDLVVLPSQGNLQGNDALSIESRKKTNSYLAERVCRVEQPIVLAFYLHFYDYLRSLVKKKKKKSRIKIFL